LKVAKNREKTKLGDSQPGECIAGIHWILHMLANFFPIHERSNLLMGKGLHRKLPLDPPVAYLLKERGAEQEIEIASIERLVPSMEAPQSRQTPATDLSLRRTGHEKH
jgi:hypothetical protein